MDRKCVLILPALALVIMAAATTAAVSPNGELELTAVESSAVQVAKRPGLASRTLSSQDKTELTATKRQVNYTWQTSVTDPVNCSAPLANSGAYVDLQVYGILANAAFAGNGVDYTVDFSGGAFSLFGVDQGEILHFTDDGFVFVEPSTVGVNPASHQPIPTAADPNNLLAILWRDLTIVYDAGLNHGVSLANLTSGGTPVAGVIEYDDIQVVGGPTLDMEVVYYYQPDPTRYQIIFAYDNISVADTVGTVGVENVDGTIGTQVFFNDVAISNGLAICFDWDGSVPAEMTGFTVK